MGDGRLIDLSRIPLKCVRTIAPERGWGGHFIHLLYFCPPWPRLGAIVCWNVGKVYRNSSGIRTRCHGSKLTYPLRRTKLTNSLSKQLERSTRAWSGLAPWNRGKFVVKQTFFAVCLFFLRFVLNDWPHGKQGVLFPGSQHSLFKPAIHLLYFILRTKNSPPLTEVK